MNEVGHQVFPTCLTIFETIQIDETYKTDKRWQVNDKLKKVTSDKSKEDTEV